MSVVIVKQINHTSGRAWESNRGTYVCRQGGVGVLQSSGYLVLLDNGLHFPDQADDALVLLVGLAEGGLEVRVRVDQPLDFLHGVHDEHVDEVLARAIQPVVEGGGALGELQVEDVDLLQDALRIVERLAAALGQGTQAVPLVADALAARVHAHAVVVLESAANYHMCMN